MDNSAKPVEVASDTKATSDQKDKEMPADTESVSDQEYQEYQETSDDDEEDPDQEDQGTLTSSQWAGLDTEGMASWFEHCSKWYSKFRKTTDSKEYVFEFDFSSPVWQRGSAKVRISNLRIHGCETWEPVFNNKMMLKWKCNVDTWPSGKSKVYVKPRLDICNKKNGEVFRYEESGNGVESIRSDGEHYVRLNKDEYVAEISTGPKDVFDKMIDNYKDPDNNDYCAVIEQITVTVVLKNA